MPALIAHRLFGEQALESPALREALGIRMDGDAPFERLGRPAADWAGEEGAAGGGEPGFAAGEQGDLAAAFLIACQGPDPLFFSFTGARSGTCHRASTDMHRCTDGRYLGALRDATALLSEQDRAVGRAFAAGQLAHFALDSVAHPFIYAQQDALLRADRDLCQASHEVHALIESDIDVAMLARLRGATVLEAPPVGALACTERASRVGGELMAQAAFQEGGHDLRPADYPRALRDMVRCYRLIEPAGSLASGALGAIERRLRPHSALQALAHHPGAGPDCPAMNPRGNPWADPETGVVSHAGFHQLLEEALALLSQMAGPYLAGAPMAGLVRGTDYNGRHAADS